MSYIEVPSTNLQHPKNIRGADINQMNENIKDHQVRIAAIAAGNNLQVSSHFNKQGGDTSQVIVTGAGVFRDGYEGQFFLSADTGTIKARVSASGSPTALDHYLRLEGAPGIVVAQPTFLFDLLTPPIVMEVRFRMSDRTTSLNIGFFNFPASLSAFNTNPNDGIYLQQSGGGDFRFRASNNGSVENGAAVTRMANDTWAIVRIELTDTPSDRALCYFDDGTGAGLLLKQTFTDTADLPFGRKIYAGVEHDAGATSMDLDRFDAAAAGSIADMT